MSKIEINRQRCKGCQLCVDACPKKIISVDKELNECGYYPVICSDMEGCIGCAFCAAICPETAIEVWREVKNG